MQHDSWSPTWIRGSKIESIVWVGKEVLAWCSGVHIIFFNTIQKKHSIYWCWNHDTGEGVRCLCAHYKLNVFAFSEKVLQPRIMVLAFPSMIKVSECVGGCRTEYLALEFTAGHHLISMGSFPAFPMTVWNWRNGDKIVTINTDMRDDVGQVIRSTLSGPTVIAQMGKTCGKLVTWDVDIVGDVAILKDHEIKLPNNLPVLWVDWCPTSKDPLLAITDIDGHIFLSNNDGTNLYRIVFTQRCGTCVDMELPVISWFRDGIVLRTTFCQIRYFTRNVRTNTWRKEWYVKSETKPYILVTHPFKKDRLFYYTLEGYLMQMDFLENDENPRITRFLANGSTYKYIDFLYPWCHHLVAIGDSKEVTVLERYEGFFVGTVDPEVEGNIVSVISHYDFPLIVLGTDQGELIFLSAINFHHPKVTARLRLQRTPLDILKFSYSGRHMVAAERNTGNCYCISLQRDELYNVVCVVHVRRGLTDLLIFEWHKKLKLLVLFIGSKQHMVGQQLSMYEISGEEDLVNECCYAFGLPGIYRFLSHVPGNPMTLVGSPYASRQLRVQKVQDFKDINLLDSMVTGHQVKLANVFVDRSWITTTALDGFTIVRDKSVRKVVAQILTHHRSDLGSLKAVVTRSGDLVVCLGYNGSLVATRFMPYDGEEQQTPTSPKQPQAQRVYKVDQGVYERNKEKILADYRNLEHIHLELLNRPLQVFPDPEMGDITWSEWRKQKQLKREEKQCEAERTAILTDFAALKEQVKNLLDANETCPELEKLPVASFDLDLKGRDQRLKAGRDVCDNLRLELEHNISEMQRVYNWLKQSFWDPQKEQGKSLFAIFGKMEVTNYPVAEPEPFEKDHLQWVKFCKNNETGIVENDVFEAWKVYSDKQLEVEASKRIKLFREEDRRIDLLFDDEEETVVVEEDVEELRALEGMTTHRYIEPSSFYPQLGYYAVSQVIKDNRLLLHDCQRLRDYFNKVFSDVYALKERVMNVIRERIERIRYIDSELSTMFGQHVPHIPTDPTWHWQEKLETIIDVQDHEVESKPYVSPSQQELLDKQAAEEERLRQLALADDFRERALMKMMDGVLEIRWEDTIKIDVPKPACMLQKKPDDYTAEDIIEVKQYEKDVQFLQEERDRYKRMLEAEYGKVIGLLQDGIDKFNGKLNDLFHLKINIEAAINQLYLRYVRGWLLIRRRMKSIREEDKLKEEIAQKHEEEKVLNVQLESFRNVLHKMNTSFQHLNSKGKAMVKKFKSEFLSLNKMNNELMERQYKRRPRANLKNLDPPDFYALARHVVTRTHSVYLPTACKDYLKSLIHIDARPPTLPPTIETVHWEHLVRLRRYKIEIELKLKGKQAGIDEVEGIIVAYEQKIEKCKSDVVDLHKKIADTKKHRIIDDLNAEIQLVLKMGQVEIQMAGDTTDTENAILISKDEIESVNKLIRAAGECKLDALSRLLSFQRGTLLKQWKHECEKKRLEDLEEELRFTESVTVTKEMQLYLTRKAKGLKDDKTPLQLQEGIEAVKKRFEDEVNSKQTRLETLNKEIAAMRKKNDELDRQIIELNVERCDMEQQRDLPGEKRQQEYTELKMKMIMRRSALVKKLQDNYAELLELQTEHELLRLKRFPTLHFKTLDDKDESDKEDDTGECPC